jgi:hypothetical protein
MVPLVCWASNVADRTDVFPRLIVGRPDQIFLAVGDLWPSD